MATTSVEKVTATAKVNFDKLTDVAKTNGDALTQSGTAAFNGAQTLAKAYQDLATRYFEKQVATLSSLSSIKSLSELVDVQKKLVTEGFDTAVSDARTIAELTTSVVHATIEPVKKQLTALQDIVGKAA